MQTSGHTLNDLKRNLIEGHQLIHVNTLVQRAKKLWPSKTALICGSDSITYQELADQATVLTQRLLAHPIPQGARILLLYENSINFYRAYYAILQTGAIVVPLNVYLHEKELEHIINDAQPVIIIASEAQKQKLAPIQHSSIVLGEEFFDNLTATHPQPFTPPSISGDLCAVILYTSGTTGLPKGVMLSSHGIIHNALQGITNFDITDHERVYAALPLFHSYMQNAAVWSPFIVGATVIIIPSITRSALLAGLQQKPSIILGIPHLYGLFALMKTAPLEKVKLFISGGDALHNKIRMAFELIYNRIIANGYGLTEAGPFVAVNLDYARLPTGCIGKPLPGMSVEIRDTDGKKLPTCAIGTLWIKGDNLMLGYYNATEATKNMIQNGWLNTGDLAYLTSDNHIVLCGREKDIIVHKGVKIYPQEVENILTLHPEVTFAAVVGKPHHDTEIPVAFVASKKPAAQLVEELKQLCNSHLAAYKVPQEIYVRPDLPLTATGKIDKKTLRKELGEGQKG